MAKIYYNRYMDRVNKGELSIAEAIILAEQEVPARWKEKVLMLLEAQA